MTASGTVHERPVNVTSLHWGFSFGGVSQYALQLDGCEQHGGLRMSSVCVLTAGRHVDTENIARLSASVVIDRSGVTDLSWFSRLRRQLRTSRPDILLTHAFNAHVIAWLLRAFGRSDLDCVATYHGEYHPPTRMKRLLAGIYNRFTIFYCKRIATRVISVAACGKQSLVERGVPAGKISVIHNGIPDTSMALMAEDALYEEVGLPAGCTIIGAVGRLEPIKGLHHLIDAFAMIAARDAAVRLLIIGSGVHEPCLRDQVQRLGLNHRVCFAGFIPNVARYYPLMDVYVLPSLSEFHSISLLEAMRAGRAIVATDVGGNTESIRDGMEGLVVAPADVAALAAAIERLVGDPDLRARLATAARARFLEEFTADVMLSRTARELLTAGRAR